MKSNTLPHIFFLFMFCLSLILHPYKQALAQDSNSGRSMASSKTIKTTKKNAAIKKKKSKIAKASKKQKKKLVKVTEKQPRKMTQIYRAPEVIVPELEIVEPDGDFHANYIANSEATEASDEELKDEFERSEYNY